MPANELNRAATAVELLLTNDESRAEIVLFSDAENKSIANRTIKYLTRH